MGRSDERYLAAEAKRVRRRLERCMSSPRRGARAQCSMRHRELLDPRPAVPSRLKARVGKPARHLKVVGPSQRRALREFDALERREKRRVAGKLRRAQLRAWGVL